MANNWVDLPQDLLVMICNFLISPDCITLQSVCKPWRATLKNSSSRLRELPWLLMLPKDKEEDPDAFDFFSLSKQKIITIRLPEMRGKRCCGSFQNGWLMTVDIDLNISLFHPWSKKSVPLPHQSTFKDNYVGVGIVGAYTIEEMRDMQICKAAISDDANMVVVIYGLGDSAFCRIGDKVWTEIKRSRFMEDVVYHNGQFYALSAYGGIYLVRTGSEDGLNASCFVKLTEGFTEGLDPYGTSYLVPDIVSDTIFVIFRDKGYIDDTRPYISCNFEIYKAPTPVGEGAPDKELIKVESLGDRIVFLGYNSSIIVMASEFSGFKGNHIYFGDNYSELYFGSPHGCCDSGVFNVEDGKIEQLFADRFHPPSAPPLWIATPPYSLQKERLR